MIEIYTDGSCNPEKNIGSWVAILFLKGEKIILKDVVKNTTHNRMELMAAIEALEYLKEHNISKQEIFIYTDSQYVAQLHSRKEKLKANNFKTGKGTNVQNADLVQTFFQITEQLEPKFIKVKAHQKKTELKNYNREADMMVRKMLRESIKTNSDKKSES